MNRMTSMLVSLLALAGCAAPCPCAATATAAPSAAAPAAAAGPRWPELYGAGLFSTGAWDFYMAFSPDQRRVLFGRADDAFQQFELLETRLGDGRWSAPVRPRFAAEWSNADPHISPDGRRVYFISDRPNAGETARRAGYDIWMAQLGATGEWGEATRVPVSDPERDEWGPMVSANGNLYFGADRPGGRGGSDMWVARFVDGKYLPAENLGDAINTNMHELEPWIAPDESYLIFSALRRPDGVGRYDLFVSRRVDGAWTKAVPIGGGINTVQSEYNHSVTPDGTWLYFSSTRDFKGTLGERFDVPRNDAALRGIGDGKGDIYRVPMSEIGM